MTVRKIGNGKIKITLTDSEVLTYFGAYENLTVGGERTRMAIGLLLSKGLSDCENEPRGDLLIEVRAKRQVGCVITVSSAENRRRMPESRTQMFEFTDSDSMISGILRLSGSRRTCGKSSLYKMPDTYRLIITPRANGDFFFMNEFCARQSASPAEISYTEEYGGLLIGGRAVETVAAAFRGTH